MFELPSPRVNDMPPIFLGVAARKDSIPSFSAWLEIDFPRNRLRRVN
jgi:hypothetical protein